jgi:hypothetical protein
VAPISGVSDAQSLVVRLRCRGSVAMVRAMAAVDEAGPGPGFQSGTDGFVGPTFLGQQHSVG